MGMSGVPASFKFSITIQPFDKNGRPLEYTALSLAIRTVSGYRAASIYSDNWSSAQLKFSYTLGNTTPSDTLSVGLFSSFTEGAGTNRDCYDFARFTTRTGAGYPFTENAVWRKDIAPSDPLLSSIRPAYNDAFTIGQTTVLQGPNAKYWGIRWIVVDV